MDVIFEAYVRVGAALRADADDGKANDHAALVYRWRLEVDGVVYHYAGSTIVGEKT